MISRVTCLNYDTFSLEGFYPVVGWAQSTRLEGSLSCEDVPDTNLEDVTYLIEGFNSDAGNTLNKLKEGGTLILIPSVKYICPNTATYG